MGNYLARIVRNSFELIPILTSGSPLPAAHSTLNYVLISFRRTYPVRSVSSSDYVRLRYLSVPPGTDCFAGAATRRSLPDRHDALANAIGEKTQHPPDAFLRLSLRLTSFAPSLSLTSGQIVRGQTQYASFGQPGTDRFVRRLCTPLLRRIRRKLRRLLSRPPKISVSNFRSNGAFRLF